MEFRIVQEIFEKFPKLVVGVLVAQSINNEGKDEEIERLIRHQEKEIQKNFSLETLLENSKIASWRQAYSLFGAKPKDYKCSVENLCRMILEGVELRSINKVVDIYNYVSLRHLVPVGGDDLDKVEGDIVLKLASGDELFRQLNSEEIKNPKPGEVVYCDQEEVLCRRWNWRECDKTKMTSQTKNVILFIEGLLPVGRNEIEAALRELEDFVKKYCSGETKTFLLDKNNSTAVFK